MVAMSGGVDSAVAAARLVDQGHDVIGVTLHLWDYQGGEHGRCCAPEDQYDARRTADRLGFPHYTFDRRDLFHHRVVDPFVDAYLTGETPSPCASCNRDVKLRVLFELADRFGASHVATGHYARVVAKGDDLYLAQGRDRTKDQSYFLYATRRAELLRLVFPLGDSLKSDVRAEALARRLPGAGKGESQELCFVGGGSAGYASFVEARGAAKVRPGPIVDEDGRVIGNHGGIHRFTIGQRKGLGVALGKPAFVRRVDADSGAVHVGGASALACAGADVPSAALREGVALPRRAAVRVRHGQAEALARLDLRDGSEADVVIRFDSPVRAVSKGQVAVFYDEGRVLGGGPIARVEPATSPAPAALLG